MYYFGILILGTLLTFLQIFRLETRNLKSIEENVYHLESRLEKLVRQASQIEEHVERDKAILLELDLKLTEAEEHYNNTNQIKKEGVNS
jgi:uncharacterized membrane-anchored protein YhcB (DUF1043 family)